jgi:adenosine 3'-phospho 5'-phosphosulfate transporter B2
VSSGGDTSWYGGVLMLGYLGFDGFTSTFQDKLFKGYHMETYNQMVWVNLCSAAISLFWLLSDSSLTEAFNFIGRHPGVMGDVIILSTAAMLGQLCILYTIREFGALLFATIMTTRQFISILLSCIIFMHPLTLPQWGGTCMVFGALYYNAFLKAARKGSKKEITIVSDDAKSGEKENLISKDGIA